MNYTMNIRGRLLDLSKPKVMGILNATPDSFYAASRVQTEEAIAARARQIVAEGGTFIDVGACSTRPGSTPASEKEEMARLRMALPVVRREVPEAIISVDTFRPDVARMVVEELGADIVNDVGDEEEREKRREERGERSGIEERGERREERGVPRPMLRMVARLGVPYILMSSEPDLRQTLLFFAKEVRQLREMGHKDIVLDPGFGFGKTVEQNYGLLAQMERLGVMELPVLVGLSRKSMIWRTLECTPEEALNGTTALNAIALMKGASILRVHDVKEAVETVRLWKELRV